MEGQRRQHSEPARAPASNCDARTVDHSSVREMMGRGDAILDIGDAPLAVEGTAVPAPIPSAASIVDIDDREPATCPVPQTEIELRARCAGRSAVRHHDQRRLLGRRADVVRARRRVVQRVIFDQVVTASGHQCLKRQIP